MKSYAHSNAKNAHKKTYERKKNSHFRKQAAPTEPHAKETHPIPPFLPSDCEILILGSFPSVKSRAEGFYYAHPQNRFWKVLSIVFGEKIPVGKDEKIMFLERHKIALWDVVRSCIISASSDMSIKDVEANDISPCLTAGVRAIFTNGTTASRLYKKLIYPKIHIESHPLPSSSPAYASVSAEQLAEMWREIISTAAPGYID